MPSLSETQQRFAAALTGGDAERDAALALLAGDPAANSRRLEAYRRNVAGNWTNALRSSYPVSERLVGRAFFAEAARRYADAHPSRSADLDDYGEDFADFLAAYPHAAPPPYLADFARLEWAVQTVYYAADSAPFDFAALAAVPAAQHGELGFRLAPAFARLRSAYPIAAIWQAHQAEDVAAVDFAPGPHAAWVVRPAGGRVGVEAASLAEDSFVAALGEGTPLAAAIAAAQASSAHFSPGESLAKLAQWGVLAALVMPGESP